MSEQTFNPDQCDSNETSKGLEEVVIEYLKQLESGEALDPKQILAVHPEIGNEVIEALQKFAEFGSDPNVDNEALGTVGDYTLLRQIGRGGMGVVYEAEQVSLGRRVALKMLPSASVLDEKQVRRFKNEAQAAAQLHHSNIVPVFSVGCERGVHYYAMQSI